MFEGLEVRAFMVLVELGVPFCEGEEIPAKHAEFGVDEDVLGGGVPGGGAGAKFLWGDGVGRQVDGDVDAGT